MEILNLKKKVSNKVDHQNIGGKEIILEFEVNADEVFYRAVVEGNWACKNFKDRRKDFNCDFPYKLYYGKVGDFGYIVSEDELEGV